MSDVEKIKKDSVFSNKEQIENLMKNSQTHPIYYKTIGWLFILFSVVILIYLLHHRKYVDILDKLAKISSKIVHKSPYMYLIPITIFITSLVYFFIWFTAAINLYSCGTIITKPKTLPFASFEYSSGIRNLQYF